MFSAVWTAACVRRSSSTKNSPIDRKSTRLNSSHLGISYAVFCFAVHRYLLSSPTRRSSDLYVTEDTGDVFGGLDGRVRASVQQHKKLANRSEEHTSELQSLRHLVCRLLLRRPPISTLFPYTTLFRSICNGRYWRCFRRSGRPRACVGPAAQKTRQSASRRRPWPDDTYRQTASCAPWPGRPRHWVRWTRPVSSPQIPGWSARRNSPRPPSVYGILLRQTRPVASPPAAGWSAGYSCAALGRQAASGPNKLSNPHRAEVSFRYGCPECPGSVVCKPGRRSSHTSAPSRSGHPKTGATHRPADTIDIAAHWRDPFSFPTEHIGRRRCPGRRRSPPSTRCGW